MTYKTLAPESRRIDQPVPGYYLIRLIRHGPKVPAMLAYSEDEGWYAVINGKVVSNPPNFDWAKAYMVVNVWLGQPIDQQEYDRLMALRFQKQHPNSSPDKKIDLTKLPSIF